MKKKFLVILGIIFLVSAVFLAGSFLVGSHDYIPTVKLNWGVDIPKSAESELVYLCNDEPSFNGDGIRYHVYSYKNGEKIKSVLNLAEGEQPTIFGDSYSSEVTTWLDEISADKNYYPDFKGKLLFDYKSQEDNSEVIFILDEEKQLFYIAERFL